MNAVVNFPAVAHRLAVIRAVLDISQGEAAHRAGTTLRSWRRWEAGHPFNTTSLLKIGAAFDLSLDWLVSGSTAGLRRQFTSGAPIESRIVVLPVGRARPAKW